MIFWDATLKTQDRREILADARAYFGNHPEARSCDVHHVYSFVDQAAGYPADVVTHITRSDALSNEQRKSQDRAMRDLGLIKVRGALGGTYWE